jgi:hypothetical protein
MNPSFPWPIECRTDKSGALPIVTLTMTGESRAACKRCSSCAAVPDPADSDRFTCENKVADSDTFLFGPVDGAMETFRAIPRPRSLDEQCRDAFDKAVVVLAAANAYWLATKNKKKNRRTDAKDEKVRDRTGAVLKRLRTTFAKAHGTDVLYDYDLYKSGIIDLGGGRRVAIISPMMCYAASGEDCPLVVPLIENSIVETPQPQPK